MPEPGLLAPPLPTHPPTSTHGILPFPHRAPGTSFSLFLTWPKPFSTLGSLHVLFFCQDSLSSLSLPLQLLGSFQSQSRCHVLWDTVLAPLCCPIYTPPSGLSSDTLSLSPGALTIIFNCTVTYRVTPPVGAGGEAPRGQEPHWLCPRALNPLSSLVLDS